MIPVRCRGCGRRSLWLRFSADARAPRTSTTGGDDTPDTLKLGYRSDEAASGWTTDTVWTLLPGETRVQHAGDFWGKCHDCSAYEQLPYGIDTLWVEGRVLTVDLMDDSLWQVQVDEGLTWIRFEQELTVVPSHFD